MLLGSYEGRHKHSRFPQSSSFARDYLVRELKCGRSPNDYQALLRPFYSFHEANGRYSKKRGETKSYTLQPQIVAALDRAMTSPLLFPAVVTDSETGKKIDLPANGIPAPLSNSLFVPSVIPLSEDSVLEAMSRVQQLIEVHGDSSPLNPKKPSGLTLRHGLRVLHHCEHWRKSVGGLPNLYVEQADGRLSYKGQTVHVIALPSVLRSLILAGTDFVSFDLRAAFYSVYVSLGRALGLTTSLTENYLANREQYHSEWASLTGHANADDFKHVAVSWLTGATLSTATMTRAVKLIGREAMQKLSADSTVRALYAEIREGMATIIRAHTEEREGRTIIVNALNKALDSMEFGKAASHILVGYEQYAIRHMARSVSGLQGIIYDGFIAAPNSVEPLQSSVREKSRTGLGVALDLTLRATKFADVEPADF